MCISFSLVVLDTMLAVVILNNYENFTSVNVQDVVPESSRYPMHPQPKVPPGKVKGGKQVKGNPKTGDSSKHSKVRLKYLYAVKFMIVKSFLEFQKALIVVLI